MRTSASDLQRLDSELQEVQRAGSGLVLAVSSGVESEYFAALAGALALPYLNLREQLSRHLLDVPVVRRSRWVATEFNGLFDSYSAMAVGRLGLLHLPELRLDPLRALESVARSRVVLAEWTGHTDSSSLVYSKPGNREYQRWERVNAQVVELTRK
jgi:hypothetical protein